MAASPVSDHWHRASPFTIVELGHAKLDATEATAPNLGIANRSRKPTHSGMPEGRSPLRPSGLSGKWGRSSLTMAARCQDGPGRASTA